MTSEDFIRLLKLRGGYEAVNHTASAAQLRILGRVYKEALPTWQITMDRLLAFEESAPWNVDISKQYFRRGGKVMYGWRLIFQAENIEATLDNIATVINAAPRAKTVVNEQALPGVKGDRNVPAGRRGKGAQGVLSAKVGAAAVPR